MSDDETHQRPDFREACRQSLLHDHTNGPFLHLRKDLRTDGAKYWSARTRELSGDAGINVADHLLVLQLSPYHSARFRPLRPRLPSQDYTIYLLQRAIERGALVVVMRSSLEWSKQVPDLDQPGRIHRSRVPRCTYLTPNVVGDQCYQELVRALKNPAAEERV